MSHLAKRIERLEACHKTTAPPIRVPFSHSLLEWARSGIPPLGYSPAQLTAIRRNCVFTPELCTRLKWRTQDEHADQAD
jgi:hypothetical protein